MLVDGTVILGGLITLSTGIIISVGGHLYKKVESKQTKHGSQINDLSLSVVRLAGSQETMKAEISGRLDVLSQHVNATNGRVLAVEEDLEAVRKVDFVAALNHHNKVMTELIKIVNEKRTAKGLENLEL